MGNSTLEDEIHLPDFYNDIFLKFSHKSLLVEAAMAQCRVFTGFILHNTVCRRSYLFSR